MNKINLTDKQIEIVKVFLNLLIIYPYIGADLIGSLPLKFDKIIKGKVNEVELFDKWCKEIVFYCRKGTSKLAMNYENADLYLSLAYYMTDKYDLYSEPMSYHLDLIDEYDKLMASEIADIQQTNIKNFNDNFVSSNEFMLELKRILPLISDTDAGKTIKQIKENENI